MSEEERRKAYPTTRILIESSRILTPTFDDGVFFVTGAQVEIMRNLLGYARREETYVKTYGPGYYLVPDADDFDDIQAIVADLEETLMGNPNTLWGYKARYAEEKIDEDATFFTYQDTTPVPEGELWVVNSMHIKNATTTCDWISAIGRTDAGAAHPLLYQLNPVAGVEYTWQGDHVMAEGDFIRAYYYNCTTGDDVYLSVWGYKMDVPS